MVLFHLPPFRDFRHFRRYGVEQKYRDCFGELPSYGRFVALMPRPFAPFCVLIHSPCGEGTGIHIADSTGLAVCASPRIPRNRTFRGAGGAGALDDGTVPRVQAACGDEPQGRVDGDQDHCGQNR